MAEARIKELKDQGVASELVLIGNKGNTYFKRRTTPIRKHMPCGQAPTAEQSSSIATELLSSFYAGEIDRVELIYTQFNSMISSTPTVRTLIPLLPSGMEMEGDEMFKLVSKDGDFAVEKETIPAAALQQRPAASHAAGVRCVRARVAHERDAVGDGQREGPAGPLGERDEPRAPGEDHPGAHGDHCRR